MVFESHWSRIYASTLIRQRPAIAILACVAGVSRASLPPPYRSAPPHFQFFCSPYARSSARSVARPCRLSHCMKRRVYWTGVRYVGRHRQCRWAIPFNIHIPPLQLRCFEFYTPPPSLPLTTRKKDQCADTISPLEFIKDQRCRHSYPFRNPQRKA